MIVTIKNVTPEEEIKLFVLWMRMHKGEDLKEGDFKYELEPQDSVEVTIENRPFQETQQ